MVAVKQIRLIWFREGEVAQLMQEVDEVKHLSHPNIIKCEGVDRHDGTLSIVLECVLHSFFLPPWLWRVLCYSLSSDLLRGITCRYATNGSLRQMLEEFGKLNEKLVASYVVQVLEGLDYLHHNGVMHGNLKAANILLTQSGDVKLSDFGISLNLQAPEDVEEGVSCTPYWTAPEVIGLERASTKSDIWSLGCTIIELLTGQLPYGNLVNDLSGACFFLCPMRRL